MRWPWQKPRLDEQAKNLISIQDPVLAAYFGVGPTSSGVQVGEGSVLGIPAMYRACALVAGTIASLPLRTLRDTADGQRQRVSSWLDEPAGPNGQTAFEWKETIVLHLMLHGEAYLAHLFNQGGAIIGAVPIHPLAVTEEQQTKGIGDFGAPMPRWTVTLNDGTRKQFTPANMTKILGMSLDGVHGLSVISVARQSLGTTIAGDRAAGRMFSNGALMAGLVTPEEDVDEDEAIEIKAKLDKKTSGWENAGELALVNRKLKFTPWSMSAEDAQFLQSRQFQIEEISRWTGVPPHLLMQTEKQTSWGTGVAEQNRGLARFTLAGWTGRMEARFSRMLRDPLFAEFDFAGLERPTPEQEIDLLIKQVDAGIITPNEARKIRNMPPIPGGETLRTRTPAPAAPAPEPAQPEETPVNVWNSADLPKLESLADKGRKLLRQQQPQNHGDGWYKISNADGDRANVYIYGYVGDEFDGNDASTFVRELRAITAPAIDLSINSPGGLVFDGVAIYSALLNHPATVDVSVDGLAASAASFIAMAGDTIAIEKPAKMMIHDAAGLVIGNASDMLEMAQLLDELSDTIAEIYADRAGGEISEWRDRMRAETWFSADQAVAAGLADTVANDTKTPDPEDRGGTKVRAAAWNSLSTGGKGMEIEEILAAMKQIIDGADGRTLTDEEVKRYEALEGDLAKKRTEAVRERQHAYEAPAPENAQVQAAVHVATKRNDDDGLEKAFDHYLRTGKENADLAELRVTNAQGEGTGSEGGFLVPDGFREKLVDRMKAFGGLANVVEDITTTTGNPLPWPTVDDTDNEGEIVAEGGTFSSGADLVFGETSLGAYKYMAGGGGSNPLRVSVELLQDAAFDIQGLISRKLGQRLARVQSQHWVSGTGVGQPKGIATGLAAVPELAGTTIAYDDLIDTIHRVDPDYRENARWSFNDTSLAAVEKIKDSNGDPIWRPFDASMATNAQGGTSGMLLGYPVTIDQAFDDVDLSTGDGKVWGVFGDLMEGYVIRRVRDVVLIVNPWTRASNGQVEYTAWARADGTQQNTNAYTAIEGHST